MGAAIHSGPPLCRPHAWQAGHPGAASGLSLSAAARRGRVGARSWQARRRVPVSPAPCPRAALIFARPAGPESVTVGSAEWVDWLTADSESPFRPGA